MKIRGHWPHPNLYISNYDQCKSTDLNVKYMFSFVFYSQGSIIADTLVKFVGILSEDKDGDVDFCDFFKNASDSMSVNGSYTEVVTSKDSFILSFTI